MTDKLKYYTGAKNGAGVWQKIISAMPQHSVFIELFFGSGIITRKKKPAKHNFGIEIDSSIICEIMRRNCFRDELPELELNMYHSDALEYLNGHFRGANYYRLPPSECLIYADPPYLQETRRSTKPLYKHEFATEAEHTALIEKLKSLECKVMLSGYRSKLYEKLLNGWRTLDIPTTTRGGAAIETVWFNFPEPLRLHDCRFIGKDFTDRQRIQRLAARRVAGLMRLPTAERQAVFEALQTAELKYLEKTTQCQEKRK